MKPDRDGTKARLLTEARDLYLEEGFAHFSLREVARRAGVSAAAVYRHYDGEEPAAIICAHVHGLASLRLTGQFARVGTDAQFARFYERAVEQLIGGLRA